MKDKPLAKHQLNHRNATLKTPEIQGLVGLALDAEFLVSEQTMQNHGVTLKQNRVLSTFGQKKSLQTRLLSLQVPDEGKKKWFQKAPKLKKQLGGSQVQETGIHRVQLSEDPRSLGFRVYGAKQGTQLHLKSSLREPLHSNLNTIGW